MKKAFLFALYFVTNNSFTNSVAPHLRFHQTPQTLTKITEIIAKKQKGGYFRFGDGELYIATGNGNAWDQALSQNLQKEMQELIQLNGPTVLKSLPLTCKEFGGFEEGMNYRGNHGWTYEQCASFIEQVKPYWGAELTDVYSQVALLFAATNHPNKCVRLFQLIKDHTHCILVGNQNIPAHIKNILFGNNSEFIPAPHKQAYNQIDHITEQCKQKLNNQNGKYTVIVTAMGAAGRALQIRLWKEYDNIFLLDFGSLMDALCGWNTRAWMKSGNFNEKPFIQKLNVPDIHIISTAALIDNDWQNRKERYIHCINNLYALGYKPFIVDSCDKTNNSFLHYYCDSVLYAGTNDLNLKNKGVNEAKGLQALFNTLPFNDDDMVVKVTGRYYFHNDNFLKLVENNPQANAIIHRPKKEYVFTGCFAMRYKYFKDMIKNLDLDTMEKEMICIEHEVSNYVYKMQENGSQIISVNKIGMTWGEKSSI